MKTNRLVPTSVMSVTNYIYLFTGIFSVILHLAVSDLILLGTTIAPELWSINSRTWTFGNSGCVAYQGLNVFTSTASSYLIGTLALHTLVTTRLEDRVALKRSRRDRNEDEEMKTSQHSLVANSDSSTPPRTMNLDYRLSDTRVPVTLPTVFVWILAASLSIPEFVLSSIIRQGKTFLCTLDSSHSLNVHAMLLVFNLLLPMFIMSTMSVLILVKLNSKKIPHAINASESSAALKLALWFVVIYFLLCAPRSVMNAYHVYSLKESSSMEVNNLFNNDRTILLRLSFSSTYLLATLVRPFLCIIILPQLRKIFSVKSNNVNSCWV